jgi:Outer membrane protein
MATANHPAIAQAARQVEAYRGSWVQSGLKENPMIGYTADEMGGYKGAGRQGVTLSQEIVPRRKRDARQGVASAEQNAARQGLQIQQQKVSNDATLAGYRLLIAQNKEYLAQELLSNCEKVVAATYNLSEAKEVPKTDYLQAKIGFNRAQISLNDARLEREAASKEIAILIGASEWTQYEIIDSLEHLPMDLDENEIYRQLIEQSPQLQRARADLDTARARLRKECQEAGINVNTEGSVLYNTYEKQTEVSVGVSIPLRIYNKNQGNIIKANSEVLAAASNVERVEKSLQSQFQNQIAQFKIAQQRVRLYRENVLTEADELLQLIMQSYQQGQSSYIELMNSQQTMFSAKLEYMDNIGMLINSRAMIYGYLLQGAYDRPEW